MIIDSHQHFWTPHPYKYPWMTDDLSPIRKSFGPRDLESEAKPHGVVGSIVVQTYSSLGETLAFLDIARSSDLVSGVVGWFDLQDPDVGSFLELVQSGRNGRYLVGVRHQVHDEPDPRWLERPEVLSALEEVADRRLVYDLLVRPRELPSAIAAARRLPNLTLVLDHMGKPDIRNTRHDDWWTEIAKLGECPNVYCKLSGMLTEADWSAWSFAGIRPYIQHCLEVFSIDRCMFGSDWPVCLLAGDYSDSLSVVSRALENRPSSDHKKVFCDVAAKVYRLALPLE